MDSWLRSTTTLKHIRLNNEALIKLFWLSFFCMESFVRHATLKQNKTHGYHVLSFFSQKEK